MTTNANTTRFIVFGVFVACVLASNCPSSSKGDQGPQGLQGPQGTQGPQGYKGATGSKGLQGDAGDAGSPSTVVGPAGPKGATGPAGSAGTPFDIQFLGHPATTLNDGSITDGDTTIRRAYRSNSSDVHYTAYDFGTTEDFFQQGTNDNTRYFFEVGSTSGSLSTSCPSYSGTFNVNECIYAPSVGVAFRYCRPVRDASNGIWASACWLPKSAQNPESEPMHNDFDLRIKPSPNTWYTTLQGASSIGFDKFLLTSLGESGYTQSNRFPS